MKCDKCGWEPDFITHDMLIWCPGCGAKLRDLKPCSKWNKEKYPLKMYTFPEARKAQMIALHYYLTGWAERSFESVDPTKMPTLGEWQNLIKKAIKEFQRCLYMGYDNCCMSCSDTPHFDLGTENKKR